MTKEELVTAVELAIENKLGMFLVEREQHYLDHCFVKDVRNGVGKGKSIVGAVILGSFATGLLSLLAWGIVVWVRKIS